MLPDSAYAFFSSESFLLSARFADAVSRHVGEGPRISSSLKGRIDGVVLKIGKAPRRVVASAMDWPGLDRSARPNRPRSLGEDLGRRAARDRGRPPRTPAHHEPVTGSAPGAEQRPAGRR